MADLQFAIFKDGFQKNMKYDLNYWEKMLRQNSSTAETISRIRWNFVQEIKPQIVLDFGSGPGWFRAFRPSYVEEMDTYDIAPWPQTGIRHERYELITFWDSLEHVKDLNSLNDLFSRTKYIALSIPIRPIGIQLKKWKHYKPGEHYHYFTVKSLQAFFNSKGFKMIKHGWPEVECGIREDIGSFIFKRKKKVVVFTNGVFDLLHPGHLFLLRKAKQLGDKLIVGIDSDRRVRSLGKKYRRPINSQEVRKEILEALKPVDEVYIFDDLEGLVRKIKPDILVKGGDYRKDQVVGRKFVESYGGKVIILPYLENRSTTRLIERIRSL